MSSSPIADVNPNTSTIGGLSNENSNSNDIQYEEPTHTPTDAFAGNDQNVIMTEILKLQGSHLTTRSCSSAGWLTEVDGGNFGYIVQYADISSTAISIVMRVFAVYINIALACDYYNKGEEKFFTWTVICIVVPIVITTLIYANVCLQDGKFSKGLCKALQTLWIVFLSSFLLRYWNSLIYAIKCKRAQLAGNTEAQRKYYRLTIREESDVTFIRLFECFLETAPQKILQISLVLQSKEDITTLQILVICSCFGSMAWCLAVYHRYNRYAQIDKANISFQGNILQLCWHFCVSVSRTLCISFVASIFAWWSITACAIHALVFGVITFIIERPKLTSSGFVNFLFCLVLGFVYLFTYIPVKDAPTKHKYTAYYVICSLENIVCVVVFMLYSSDNLRSSAFLLYSLCAMALAFYYVGIVFMIIYYLYFHPRITARKSKRSVNDN